MLGSVSAAMSREWLSWAGVSHVVNVLGKYKGNDITPEWQLSQDRRYKGIQYLDWPVMRRGERDHWREVFAMIASVLLQQSACVLVHCKNGRDRSASVLFAFLRAVHKLSHEAALDIVKARRNVQGRPLFDYSRQDSIIHTWIESSVGTELHAESGYYNWKAGTG